jgi:arylsulfatase A-like enzyme
MKADAWEVGHRIPFIARWLGKIAAGVSSDETICFTDVMATFAEMLALDLPEGAGSDSYSFWPALQGKEQPPRPPLVIQSGSGLMTVRMDQWKLIDGLGSGGFSKPAKIKPEPGGPAGQLYDLSKDEAESENVYSSRPELVETLRSAMDAVVGEGRQN